jgi:chemotaxis protein MotB
VAGDKKRSHLSIADQGREKPGPGEGAEAGASGPEPSAPKKGGRAGPATGTRKPLKKDGKDKEKKKSRARPVGQGADAADSRGAQGSGGGGGPRGPGKAAAAAQLKFSEAPKRGQEAQAAEEEGAPAWMTTFADMMTLLLCFFVLLLAMSEQDVVKFKKMVGSVRETFGVSPVYSEDAYLAEHEMVLEKVGENLDRTQRRTVEMATFIKKIHSSDPMLRDDLSIVPEREGIMVRVDALAMFEPGKARIRTEALPVLTDVIETMKEQNYKLVVRGHTDDTLISTSIYPSNWELSAARAAAVLRHLVEVGGLSPTRVKATGYGAAMPLVPNTTPENRARNRRVEFFYNHPQARDVW